MTPNRESRFDRYHPRTRLIHGNRENKRWDFDHHLVPPMSATSAYRLETVHRGAQGFEEFVADQRVDGEGAPIYIYDRLDEPTRGMLEDHLAEAEDGDMAVCFVSGMAAISAAIGVTAQAGDEIVSHHTVYGCTYSLFTTWLPRMGIQVRFVDLRDAEAITDAVTDRTRIIYGETPVNPTLDLIDIAQVHQCIERVNAHRPANQQVVWMVDNTFATPYCQRPLQHGADLVVQSLTKGISGFGTDMGGVVIGGQAYHQPLLMYRKDFGGMLPPKSAWPILVYGLPTLPTRMASQQQTALRVAEFLSQHPKVRQVSYPGLETCPQRALAQRQMVSPEGLFAPGSVLYFVLQGQEEEAAKAAESFVNAIAREAYSITLAVSLGQIRTLIEEPYTMTHASLPQEVKRERGLEPGGIRLSVGLEDWRDIVADLQAAFECL